MNSFSSSHTGLVVRHTVGVLACAAESPRSIPPPRVA